jgi:CheY-like chemotaxis protein
MEVLEAANATEAIQIGSHPGIIDLLLTDLEMPGVSGWNLGTKLMG